MKASGRILVRRRRSSRSSAFDGGRTLFPFAGEQPQTSMRTPASTMRLFQNTKKNKPQQQHQRTKKRHYSSTTAIATTNSTDLPSHCHTLIIGGGPVGSFTAYHLARSTNKNSNGNGKSNGNDGHHPRGTTTTCVVVERDPTGRASSAARSAGGIRQQFSLRENVLLSLHGRDFLRQSARLLPDTDVNFVEGGYLFLAATESGRAALLKNHRVQREAGATDIVLMEPEALKRQFPWLNTDDILLGSLGTRGEGWFDPWALVSGLRCQNQAMGVTYIHGEPVGSDCDASTGRVNSVDLKLYNGCATADGSSSSSSKNRIHTITTDYVVNAAGAHCASVLQVLSGGNQRAAPLRYPLPVKPRKRSIYFFHCADPEAPATTVPLTIDPLTGVYVRSEGHCSCRTFLCGVSPAVDRDFCPESDSLDHADADLFESTIWPALYHRVPAFGNLKVQSSWAGLYEYNCIDQNAIIDFHPELPNVLLLNGFSGHGLQQSPGVGRAAAELLEYGSFQTLDLSIFGYDRCMGKAPPVLEVGIV